MTVSETMSQWQTLNQTFLMTSLTDLREQLAAHIASEGETADPYDRYSERLETWAGSSPPALDHVRHLFGLSPFERSILLWAAGTELDGGFARLFGEAQGDPGCTFPTFSLALSVLRDAHWSALSPEGPLRRWNLIHFKDGPGLTGRALRIDERILNYLVGVAHGDQNLLGLIRRVTGVEALSENQIHLCETIAAAWSKTFEFPAIPVVQLCGPSVGTTRAVAAETCRRLGLDLCMMNSGVLPAEPREQELLARRWHRESILSETALLLELEDVAGMDGNRRAGLGRFIENLPGFLFLGTSDRFPQRHRPQLSFDVSMPRTEEQCALWQSILDEHTEITRSDLMSLATSFNMTAEMIRGCYAGALGILETADEETSLFDALWSTARVQARPKLDDLASRIDAHASWDDLVLEPEAEAVMRQIVDQVRQKARVYHEWGFSDRANRGLGLSALFAGPSGTGKTMAAEVLAKTLDMDLYRIDLAALVSKYIGETEKNLRRIFDAAETGGSILLFDEADALFGKRSEVKDSHDRYANIEVSYLLQRMEAFRGLAILTSNLRDALDEAFTRRIRFIVELPFPDLSRRALIWSKIFPPETPTHCLDPEKLARLNVAGGNIRNIALSAAFLAARTNEPVTMSHILEAAKTEYQKMEKPLTSSELRGWT